MFSLMIFMLFFFFGLIAMLWYMFRASERQFQGLKEEIAQVRVLVRALESRVANNGVEEKSAAQKQNPDVDGSRADPLLHLSFEGQAKLPSGPELDLRDYG